MARICKNVWVTSFITGVPDRFEYVCWDASDDDSSSGGGGGGGGGGSSGVSVGSGTNFGPSPSGSGTVVAPGPTPDYDTSTDLNPGWNAGAHSITEVPATWVGMISLDVPDIDGERPSGVAVGLCPVAALPTSMRSGYGHLRYGLVFTADSVRVIHDGGIVLEVPYATVLDAREPGATTDLVSALMYGDMVQWVVNGMTLYAGAFSMPGPYALDSTFYLAFDAVDNPLFTEGEWPGMGDALTGMLAGFEMAADASAEPSLTITLPAFAAQFSQEVMWNLFGGMRGFEMAAGELDGLRGSIGPFGMVASQSASYSTMAGSIGPFSAAIGMDPPDDTVKYCALTPTLPRFAVAATGPASASVDAALKPMVMRASAETSYSELVAELRGLRFSGYGGELTPLVQITEAIGSSVPIVQNTYIGIAFMEHVDGTATAAVYATVTADGSEEITAQDTASAIMTMLDSIAEQIGAGERFTASVFRTGTGALVDDSQAWVVNTESSASTRYDNYGFNSFATVRGKQFGVRQDGLYLLSGTDDAGSPITSGVALGMHDFGTQALKRLDSVYAGVSSTGTLFIRVGDGVNSYSYRARRNDPHMKVQRFDIGRGIRTNYFTFDLTSDADAFELDSVTFHVLPTSRRI